VFDSELFVAEPEVEAEAEFGSELDSFSSPALSSFCGEFMYPSVLLQVVDPFSWSLFMLSFLGFVLDLVFLFSDIYLFCRCYII